MAIHLSIVCRGFTHSALQHFGDLLSIVMIFPLLSPKVLQNRNRSIMSLAALTLVKHGPGKQINEEREK